MVGPAPSVRRSPSAGFFPTACAVLLLCAFVSHASPSTTPAATTPAATAPAYNVNHPIYPVTYTEPEKSSQRQAARDVIRQINTTIAAGGERFTVLPGVYRIAAKGPDTQINFAKDKPFRLSLANTEFILENGGAFISPPHCESITIAGPVKFDAEPLAFSQATVLSHDPLTGLTRLKIMPGYKLELEPKGTIDAFTPAGAPLPNPSWAGYADAKVIDSDEGIVELKTGINSGNRTDFRGLYAAGNLVALRAATPVLLSIRDLKHLALKDVDLYTGAGFAWGSGTGNWSFSNIRGIRRPGTNRLYGAGGCQVGNFGGNVTFDTCEFSSTTDDLINYSGAGLSMLVRQETTRQLLLWGASLSTGDTLNIYSHTDFHLNATALVTAVAEVKDPTLAAQADSLIVQVLKAPRVGVKPVHRVTLDRDITASPADFTENATSRRPSHFILRNCYLHDSGARILVQGFQHGLFENNRFERISGGLALSCDTRSWEGPTCQDITVRNNVFIDTTCRDGWGTGKAALFVGPTLFPNDPSKGVAFHGVSITGNRIIGSTTGGILVSNAADVAIKDNLIEHPFTLGAPGSAIRLLGSIDCQVSGNTVIGSPGLGFLAEHVHRLTLKGNNFQDCYRGVGTVLKNFPANFPTNFPAAVIALLDCKTADLQTNWITGSDAPRALWISTSDQIHLDRNRASKLNAPSASLLGTGPGNTALQNDDPTPAPPD